MTDKDEVVSSDITRPTDAFRVEYNNKVKKIHILLALLLVFSFCSEEPEVAEQPPTTVSEVPVTATVVKDTTTTTVQDTTTTSVVANSCNNCNYINIGDLLSKSSEVPRVAWDDSQRILNKNISTNINENVELIIREGPSTIFFFNENEQSIQKGIDFWKNFKLPQKYYAFFYSFSDLDWAINEINGYGFWGDNAKSPCVLDEAICTGANSGLHHESPYHGVGKFGINSADSWDRYRYGPIHIHEFTHSAVAAQWIGVAGNPQENANQATPCWLNEGIAHFAGLSVGIDTYSEYVEVRKGQVTGRHLQPPFNDYSTSAILNYYNESVPRECLGKPDYVLGYSVGYLTVEALSAMAGSDSAMHMYTEMASGKDFEAAFGIIYDIAWSEAKPVLAQYISSVIGEFFNS